MVINVDALTNGVNFREFGSRLPRIPVASAISGLIVGALILMTPNPWFESFIVQTGLPEMIASAQPPLGARARIVFALIAALVVTGGAWLALALLLGNPGRSVPPFVEPDLDEEEGRAFDFLRRRRADSHPDAPPRRPIFATDDLGAPLDLVDVAPDEDEDEAQQPQEDAEAAAEAFELSREDFAVQHGFEQGQAEAEEEIPGSEPLFTIPLRGDNSADSTDDGETAAEPAEPQSAGPQEWKAPAPGFEVRAELADLVSRLEAGLARRRARLDRQREAAAVPADAPAAGNGNLDGALREALDALQKLEVRGA